MKSVFNTMPAFAVPEEVPSKGGLSWAELGLLLAGLLVIAVAVLGPFVPQMAHYHGFADQRNLWGVPQAMDVLSNLPFAVAGVWGLLALHGTGGKLQRQWQGLAGLFFIGLIVTAICSSTYHLDPDPSTLALDRLGMVLAFAGLLGLAVAERISTRAGVQLAVAVLIAGPLSIMVWANSGNLLPWVILQGGGLLLLVALMACKPKNGAWGLQVAGVVTCYAIAKLFEMSDHFVFDLTNGGVSGHSLKHVVAACAAWPVIGFVHNIKKA